MKIGDKVMVGVFLLGEWKPMHPGIIVDLSNDGTLASVDRMSLHGGAPWINFENLSDLRPFNEVPHA